MLNNKKIAGIAKRYLPDMILKLCLILFRNTKNALTVFNCVMRALKQICLCVCTMHCETCSHEYWKIIEFITFIVWNRFVFYDFFICLECLHCLNWIRSILLKSYSNYLSHSYSRKTSRFRPNAITLMPKGLLRHQKRKYVSGIYGRRTSWSWIISGNTITVRSNFIFHTYNTDWQYVNVALPYMQEKVRSN